MMEDIVFLCYKEKKIQAKDEEGEREDYGRNGKKRVRKKGTKITDR